MTDRDEIHHLVIPDPPQSIETVPSQLNSHKPEIFVQVSLPFQAEISRPSIPGLKLYRQLYSVVSHSYMRI